MPLKMIKFRLQEKVLTISTLKALVFVPGEENSFTDTVSGATLVFRKEIFKKVQFEKVNRAEDYFLLTKLKNVVIPFLLLTIMTL